MRGRVLAASALLCAAALGGACRGPPTFEVAEVLVADSQAAQRLASAGITRAVLREAATDLLSRAEGFAPAGQGGWRARRCTAQVLVSAAEVLIPSSGSGPVAQVDLVLELTPRGAPSRRELGRAAEPVGLEPGGLRAALERAARSALSRAVSTLALERAAETKSTAALVADLDAAEVPARLAAVRALADRGEHGAVPALMSALEDRDPAVVEAAVGGLAQLGDPRAAPALIELARRRGSEETAAMAHILGDLGGEDARAWLVTMASGHPDAAVREAAHEALAQLEARSEGASGARR